MMSPLYLNIYAIRRVASGDGGLLPLAVAVGFCDRLSEDDPLTQQIPTRVRSECNANPESTGHIAFVPRCREHSQVRGHISNLKSWRGTDEVIRRVLEGGNRLSWSRRG